MPRNIVIDSTAIISIVAAAFFGSGGLKAGTPFDTASTPVIAVQPLENAVKRRNSDRLLPVAVGTGTLDASGWMPPANVRQTPTAISRSIAVMKKYVGMAKMRPDS